jgi:hypothetical protein
MTPRPPCAGEAAPWNDITMDNTKNNGSSATNEARMPP